MICPAPPVQSIIAKPGRGHLSEDAPLYRARPGAGRPMRRATSHVREPIEQNPLRPVLGRAQPTSPDLADPGEPLQATFQVTVPWGSVGECPLSRLPPPDVANRGESATGKVALLVLGNRPRGEEPMIGVDGDRGTRGRCTLPGHPRCGPRRAAATPRY